MEAINRRAIGNGESDMDTNYRELFRPIQKNAFLPLP